VHKSRSINRVSIAYQSLVIRNRASRSIVGINRSESSGASPTVKDEIENVASIPPAILILLPSSDPEWIPRFRYLKSIVFTFLSSRSREILFLPYPATRAQGRNSKFPDNDTSFDRSLHGTLKSSFSHEHAVDKFAELRTVTPDWISARLSRYPAADCYASTRVKSHYESYSFVIPVSIMPCRITLIDQYFNSVSFNKALE